MLKVGLTGGIATGKSLVGSMFADLGAGGGEYFRVCDRVYPNSAGLEDLADADGEVTGGGTGGDDHIGAFLVDDADEACRVIRKP